MGEDANDQEELILALSAAELKELLAEVGPKPAKPKKRSQPKKGCIDIGAVPAGEVARSAAKPRRRAGQDTDRPEEMTSELVPAGQVKQGRQERQSGLKSRQELDVEEAPSAPEPAALVGQGRRERPTGLRPRRELANDGAPSVPEPPALTSSGRRERPLVPRPRTVSPTGRRATDKSCPSEVLPAAMKSAAAARAGAGARAFAKKTRNGDAKREEAEPAAPVEAAVRLNLTVDDDSDFEGTGGNTATRALLEKEVSRLCERREIFTPAAAAVAAAAAHGNAGVADVESRMAEFRAEAASEQEERFTLMGMSAEQKVAAAYVEELELKSELHFKAKLHGLTHLETAELFQQRGFDAPKEGDFEIVQRLMAERQSKMTVDFRNDVLKNKGRAKTRYVDGEAVETKDKYIWERKETHESIRATTCNILLIGNSSKARRDHRSLDEIKQKTGPVSNPNPRKKKPK